MFAYIKLIAENKFDTIPFTLIHNYDKIPLPPNKNKQYFVHYKNEEPKLAVLIYVEETITELEKLIASRRTIVPTLRNLETASEMSDNNESNSKPKVTLNFKINPAVNQQLEQLRTKLAIHCGQNVWITVQNYNNAKAAAGTDAIFVKNIAVDIFTREVLKSSSVTGKMSNRTKAPAKPKLDPLKMLAVRDIYRYYLKEHRQLSEDEINARIDDYTDYIRVKISDLERPKKSTRSEGSDKKEDEKNKTRNNAPALKKKTDESSSEGTSFSESSTDSEEESADSESKSSGDERTLN
ncbi:uncharacterized protein LOC123268730 [Cotesia glomerata]|uniref:BEN domain-containing protein n=1 Tax=Cotesia glomerata TaxID=32391 RepID=A0AAV7I7T3_COTGL|nr:uncharacterized protein LOC123268730 [Cotesia glomerata]KAH0546773.1 hypothetical protein KQX54_015119 [Cotesia glomerata]